MKSVAIIGASSNRRKFGNKALRAFEHKGYRVFAVNPNEREVEGHRTFASVLDITEPIDIATVYVPADVGVRVLDEIGKKGIAQVWLNPGADEPAVVKRARELDLNVTLHCSILAIGESPSRY